MTKRPSLNGNLTQICPLAVRLEEDLKIEKYRHTSLGNLNGIISNYYLYTNIPQRHTHARTHVYVVRVRMCERESVCENAGLRYYTVIHREAKMRDLFLQTKISS